MRKYEPIWLQLKIKGTVSLAAPPTHHRRIILAVRKEKTKDIGWKVLCLEKRERWKLEDTSTDSLLTFSLKPAEILSYATLTIHDL
jgi:hypothetical protein